MDVDPQVLELGIRLSEAAARSTATSVVERIRAVKSARQDRDTIAGLEEIVNELLEGRSELLRIAQGLKEQLVGQRISEDDVRYITNELVPKLREAVEATARAQGADPEASLRMIDAISPLVSVEAITVLQLIGFNFKQALGEPLTALVGGAISSRRPAGPAHSLELQRLSAEREVAYVALARDAEAFERFRSLFPSQADR